MSIVLARIDNRLIHGQVIEAWVPSVKADCIVVANDQVARHPFQRVLMEAAVPRGIRVEISAIEQIAAVLGSDSCRNGRVLLLFASSEDALKAHRAGVDFSELNLGNMHAGDGKLRYSCTIALDADDIENLGRLEEDGVQIVSQCIPSDRRQPWRKMIRTTS